MFSNTLIADLSHLIDRKWRIHVPQMQETVSSSMDDNLLPKQVDCFFADARNSCLCRETYLNYCAFHKHADFEFQIMFFAAVNHLNGPLRKQNFALTGSKGQGLWFVIGGFRSVLCVSVFQGSLLVIVIMIDGSEKRNCEGGFWTLEFACLWKAH